MKLKRPKKYATGSQFLLHVLEWDSVYDTIKPGLYLKIEVQHRQNRQFCIFQIYKTNLIFEINFQLCHTIWKQILSLSYIWRNFFNVSYNIINDFLTLIWWIGALKHGTLTFSNQQHEINNFAFFPYMKQISSLFLCHMYMKRTFDLVIYMKPILTFVKYMKPISFLSYKWNNFFNVS